MAAAANVAIRIKALMIVRVRLIFTAGLLHGGIKRLLMDSLWLYNFVLTLAAVFNFA